MPVLKIKKNGSWVEVWGATIDSSISASVPKITSITLHAALWAGTSQPYSQSVVISTATTNSKVDLQPTAQQIVDLQDAEISLMVQNNSDGTFTAYAIGNKPTQDYTVQALITEVVSV